jgi:GT2 family glycosyltransferase
LIHQVVICSKDRLDLLRQLLVSFNSQTISASLRVQVVLNSDDYVSFVEEFSNIPKKYQLTFSRTSRGTSSARNEAINRIEYCDVLHFVDDDVMIPVNYFKNVEELFELHKNFIGGAGQEVSKTLKPTFHINRVYDFISNLFDFKYIPGKLTSSSTNFWISNDFGVENELEVDWLPGCAMFFDWNKVKNFRFNERLELGPLEGYALGEDVDYTFRISRTGKLIFFPGLNYDHFFAPNKARKDSNKLASAQGRFKAHLKNTYPIHFSSIKTLAAFFFQNLPNRSFSYSPQKISSIVFFFLGYTLERISKVYSQTK